MIGKKEAKSKIRFYIRRKAKTKRSTSRKEGLPQPKIIKPPKVHIEETLCFNTLKMYFNPE